MNDIDETMMGNADALARQRGLKDLLQYSVIVIASVPVMIIYICSEILRKGCYDRSSKGLITEK